VIQLSEIVEIENRPARTVTRQQATTPVTARSPRRRLANGTGAVSTVEAPPGWDEADLAAEPEPTTPDPETLDR